MSAYINYKLVTFLIQNLLVLSNLINNVIALVSVFYKSQISERKKCSSLFARRCICFIVVYLMLGCFCDRCELTYKKRKLSRYDIINRGKKMILHQSSLVCVHYFASHNQLLHPGSDGECSLNHFLPYKTYAHKTYIKVSEDDCSQSFTNPMILS